MLVCLNIVGIDRYIAQTGTPVQSQGTGDIEFIVKIVQCDAEHELTTSNINFCFYCFAGYLPKY